MILQTLQVSPARDVTGPAVYISRIAGVWSLSRRAVWLIPDTASFPETPVKRSGWVRVENALKFGSVCQNSPDFDVNYGSPRSLQSRQTPGADNCPFVSAFAIQTLLFVTSRSPTGKHPKWPELLPYFCELLPPGPEKRGIGACIGRIFEVRKKQVSGKYRPEQRMFP